MICRTRRLTRPATGASLLVPGVSRQGGDDMTLRIKYAIYSAAGILLAIALSGCAHSP
jgi:hypothetical protein